MNKGREKRLDEFGKKVIDKWFKGENFGPTIVVKREDIKIVTESIVAEERWDDALDSMEKALPNFFQVLTDEIEEVVSMVLSKISDPWIINVIYNKKVHDLGVVISLIFLPIYVANRYRWPDISLDIDVIDYMKSLEKKYRWRYGPLMREFENKLTKAFGPKYYKNLYLLMTREMRFQAVEMETIAKITLTFFDFVNVIASEELESEEGD